MDIPRQLYAEQDRRPANKEHGSSEELAGSSETCTDGPAMPSEPGYLNIA